MGPSTARLLVLVVDSCMPFVGPTYGLHFQPEALVPSLTMRDGNGAILARFASQFTEPVHQ